VRAGETGNVGFIFRIHYLPVLGNGIAAVGSKEHTVIRRSGIECRVYPARRFTISVGQRAKKIIKGSGSKVVTITGQVFQLCIIVYIEHSKAVLIATQKCQLRIVADIERKDRIFGTIQIIQQSILFYVERGKAVVRAI